MKTYKIFKNPTGQYEAVKQGWSWPAFFFEGIWACVKKIWGLGIVLIILALFAFAPIPISVTDTGEMEISGSAIFLIIIKLASLIIKFILGAYGNELREKNLISRGYQYQKKDTEFIIAQNPQMAIIQYISKYEK